MRTRTGLFVSFLDFPWLRHIFLVWTLGGTVSRDPVICILCMELRYNLWILLTGPLLSLAAYVHRPRLSLNKLFLQQMYLWTMARLHPLTWRVSTRHAHSVSTCCSFWQSWHDVSFSFTTQSFYEAAYILPRRPAVSAGLEENPHVFWHGRVNLVGAIWHALGLKDLGSGLSWMKKK